MTAYRFGREPENWKFSGHCEDCGHILRDVFPGRQSEIRRAPDGAAYFKEPCPRCRNGILVLWENENEPAANGWREKERRPDFVWDWDDDPLGLLGEMKTTMSLPPQHSEPTPKPPVPDVAYGIKLLS